MSSLSVTVQRELRDDQFIGDLINLFERRKIKTGDPSSLETFDSVLASNDAFRSQLFTLCTAISHMSAEDLSGEQLLALVAHALAGTAVYRDDGTVEVPDAMRSAFLPGYDAWTNRTFEPKEPLPWPTPRQAEPRDEVEPMPQSTNAEAGQPRTPPPGIHTMQEALDIARERRLADPAARSSPRSDASIEGLTLSELKALLAEIEQRVSRIQPHLSDLTSIVRPPVDEFGRRERMHGIDESYTPRHIPASAPEFPFAASTIDISAMPSAGDATPAQATHRTTRPTGLNEAAFLARHAYLRPTRRLAAGTPAADGAPIPAAAQVSTVAPATQAGPLLAIAPADPEPSALAVPPVEPSPMTAVGSMAPTPVAAAPVAAPISAHVPTAVAAPIVTPRSQPVTARLAPMPYLPYDEPASLAIGRLRISPRMAIGILTAFAALIVVVSGLAGLFIYPSFHPKTMNDFPDLKPLAQSNAGSIPDAASSAQVLLAAPDDPSLASSPPPSSHSLSGGSSAAPKVHARASTQPRPVNVWPATNQAPREAAAAPAASLAAATAARRTPPQTPPLYVPSTTMIAYAVTAPQPAYPKDQPRGINGTVVVQLTISRDGLVTDIRIVSGPEEMRPATIQAVQTWRFRPYLVNGSPADVVTTVGFLFKGQ